VARQSWAFGERMNSARQAGQARFSGPQRANAIICDPAVPAWSESHAGMLTHRAMRGRCGVPGLQQRLIGSMPLGCCVSRADSDGIPARCCSGRNRLDGYRGLR
jgi:hypothetical protein